MTTSDWAERFAGADLDLTDVYETVMLPRLFAPWAEVLLDELAPAAGSSLLDVATGPGTVARAAAQRIGASGRVIGADVSPAMIAAARAHPALIEYLEAPADALPFADDTVDAVTCQHGLQFFPDRVAALREMRRVTRPGGRLAVAVWGPIEDSAVFSGLALGIATAFGGDAARGYLAGPWALSDADALHTLASAAGWGDVQVVTRLLPLTFDGGPAQLVASLGITPLGARVAAMGAAERGALVDAVAFALDTALEADGVVRSSTSALFLLATA